MKKIFLGYFISTTCFLAMTNSSYSQKLNGESGSTQIVRNNFQPGKNIPPVNNAGPVQYKNELNSRAVRHFNSIYNDVVDVKWYNEKEGLFAYFTQDSIKSRVSYDKKGRFLSTIREYDETRLPSRVRHLVKSTYYDFSIYKVIELNYFNQTIYYIKMEDKTSWKMARIADDEMTIVEEFAKA